VDVFVQAKRDGAAAVRFFTYQCDTNSVAWELESELNDVDRPVFFLEKDVSLARLSWPKRTAIGQRAW
jgi:hypothetical protein